MLPDPTSQAEYEASAALRDAWKAIQTIKSRPGWPKGGPRIRWPLGDHFSHYRTPEGIVYRSEPYGPFGPKKIILLGKLLDEWDITMDPRGSTHHPGGTTQLLFRRKTVAMISDLSAQWRDEAALLRRRGLNQAADVAESYAADLEAAVRDDEQVTLTLKDAAEESGYSASHLSRLVREGKIPNAGRANAPRIAMKDLPRRLASSGDLGHLDRTQIVRLAIKQE